ncbi:hypothetical protein IJ541_09130 [bacterium]|nr:hypothetical protein [bacterium]
MKNFLTSLFLIIICIIFSIFTVINGKSKTVLSVITPTKILIDLDNSKTPDNNEAVCIQDVEAFSLEPSEEFFDKYSKKFNLTLNDMISLGYLAQEFAQKNITNKKVSINLTQNINKDCKFAKVYIDGVDYGEILANSGFGIVNGEIPAENKFKTNLENARKLNLVILNHHSGKFHTLDCPYGKAAHDMIIIPKKQLPENAKPCKFCHNQQPQNKKKYKLKKDINIYNIPQIPQPPLNVIDGNIRVYFTDYTKNLVPNNLCKTTVCQEFVKLVDNTKTSIDIAIYGYDDIPAITQALKQAVDRGVKIRFVYDENYYTNYTYYKSNNLISDLSSEFRSDKTASKTQSNMLMHNKFVIFDESIVYTGSMNFSRPGISAYDVNDVVIINSKEISTLYLAEFEQMLNGKFHTAKEKLNLNNRFIIGNSEIEVYFSPKDKPTKRIIDLINNAKSYIYLPTFLITHEEITKALINAQKRGIDVRVIIDANSTSTRNTKHKILRRNGIMLKTENYAGKLHAKTIIIDDNYLITGSMNFSNSGENKNDENLLIIKNQNIAKAHKNFFLYLWTMIPNKYLKQNAKPEGKDSIGSCSDGIDNNFNGLIDKAEEFCK